MGCVGGESTLLTETEESGWLLLPIRLSSAVDLGPTEEASSLSGWCKKGFQQYLCGARECLVSAG